jgi:hypothetical protein
MSVPGLHKIQLTDRYYLTSQIPDRTVRETSVMLTDNVKRCAAMLLIRSNKYVISKLLTPSTSTEQLLLTNTRMIIYQRQEIPLHH